MAVLSRSTRTAETRRRTEQAIVDATLALLEDGPAFSDLGIDQIVRRAGLSRPTFYAYFRDKRGLVLRLGASLEHDLRLVAEPWLAGAPGPAAETIASVLGVFRAHAGAVRAITEAATYDPEVSEFWRALHDHFIPGARERIAAGGAKLDPAAIEARAYALVWMTERALTEHIARPTVDEARLVEQLGWLWEAATA